MTNTNETDATKQTVVIQLTEITTLEFAFEKFWLL